MGSSKKFHLRVSKTNYNRQKARTHRLDHILSLEGFETEGDFLLFKDRKIPFEDIELQPIIKRR